MPQYDYIAWVKEEVGLLERELGEPGAREQLADLASRLEIDEEVALAAFFRAAKRSGFTVKVMLDAVAEQLRQAGAQRT